MASPALFQATKRRAYFRNITILVPKTWERQPTYKPAGRESFDTANVIIDKINPDYGDTPYVKQVRGCGQSGEFMHLTPTFVKNRILTTTKYGDPGNT